ALVKISLPLLFTLGSIAHAQPVTISPGEGFDVERYTVALRPDIETTALSATETILVRATSAQVTLLAFTPNALRVSEATLNSEPVEVFSTEDALVFALPRALRKGERATLQFRIEGTPARGVTAEAGGIYTSYFACDWMVCLQDAPGDKAHLHMDLFLPAGVQSLGVGRARPVTLLPGGLTRHRWRSTRPYSPYLYAFAAGRFKHSSTRTAQAELVY